MKRWATDWEKVVQIMYLIMVLYLEYIKNFYIQYEDKQPNLNMANGFETGTSHRRHTGCSKCKKRCRTLLFQQRKMTLQR